MGVADVGSMGIDVMHFNLHKTFSTPHGGGGPGAGPVGVKEILAPFLPVPVVVKGSEGYALEYDLPQSIGKVRAFYANFGIIARAYAYIRSMGPEGLRAVAENAVLNANYLRTRLKEHYHLPYETPSMHECVFTDKLQAQYDVHTLDVAKRLMDYGFHPPTVYFPLVVSGALMIEPTETESKEVLDQFIEAMINIAEEARDNPDILHSAPHTPKGGPYG